MGEPVPFVQIINCSASYGKTVVIDNLTLSIRHGERWAVLGPNGAGKSTLVKLVAGLEHARSGDIKVNGMNLRHGKARARARIMAYVPQKPDGIIPYTVSDYLMLGRYAAMGISAVPSQSDREAVDEAIGICDIGNICGRMMNTLSGGELQRVLLAGAVAQKTPLLILDEPTTFLDPAHERLFFGALERLHRQRELTLLMVTHDINSALTQCTHVIALRNKKAVFCGPVEQFRKGCPENLDSLFDITFRRYMCGDNGAEVFGAWGGVL